MLEVVEPLDDAVLDVAVGLLAGLGDVHHADQTPLRPVGDRAERRGTLLHHVPVQRRARRTRLPCVAPIDSRPMPCLPASRGPVGDATAGTARSNSGSEYGRRWSRASVRFHILVWLVTGSSVREQLHDHVEALLEQRPRLGRVETEHDRVGRQRARPEPEHEPTTCHVVELHGTFGDHVRVVVRERHHAGSELDVLRTFGGRGDEDLGRRDDLGAGRVVLTDPGLVPAESVEMLRRVRDRARSPTSGSPRLDETGP